MIRVHESLDPIIDPYQDGKMVHSMSVSPSAVPKSNEKLVCLNVQLFPLSHEATVEEIRDINIVIGIWRGEAGRERL